MAYRMGSAVSVCGHICWCGCRYDDGAVMNLIQQMSILADEFDNRTGITDERDRHRELATVWKERLEMYQGFLATEKSPQQREKWALECERAERVMMMELALCQ